MANAMKNVTVEVIGNKARIEFDLNEDLGISKSGKTNLVASSGFAEVPGKPGYGFTFTAWRPLTAKAA